MNIKKFVSEMYVPYAKGCLVGAAIGAALITLYGVAVTVSPRVASFEKGHFGVTFMD